jgi:hypothetical protein
MVELQTPITDSSTEGVSFYGLVRCDFRNMTKCEIKYLIGVNGDRRVVSHILTPAQTQQLARISDLSLVVSGDNSRIVKSLPEDIVRYDSGVVILTDLAKRTTTRYIPEYKPDGVPRS